MKRNRFFSLLLAVILLVAFATQAFAVCGTLRLDPAHPFENSSFCTVGEYSIHYRTFSATPSKGQIFMIHGFALSSYCFVALAEELVAAGYTCVLADLPNFGYSTRDTAETTQIPREDLMYAVMQSISSDPWYVAGHSMGGYVALSLATKYPAAVKNVLLYGTCGNDGANDAANAIMGNDLFLRGMGKMMETAGKSKALVRLLYVFACNDLSFALHYDVSKITDPYYIEGTGEGALRNFLALPKTDYAAVRAMPPILFVNGDHDYVVQDSSRKNLRAALPDGSIDYVVKGAGHMCIETHAKEVAGVTLDFFAAQ